jgi:hypothetical protein
MTDMNKTALKDEVANSLIDWHFQIDPGLQEVYRIVSEHEDLPEEPIKLLEVTDTAMETGIVHPFGFAPSGDITYPCVIATITPGEMERVRAETISLPHDWSLQTALRFASKKLEHAA